MNDRVLYGAVFGAGVLTAVLAGFGLSALRGPDAPPPGPAAASVSASPERPAHPNPPPLLGAIPQKAPAEHGVRDVALEVALAQEPASFPGGSEAPPAPVNLAVEEASSDVPSPPMPADRVPAELPAGGRSMRADRADAVGGPLVQIPLPVPMDLSPARSHLSEQSKPTHAAPAMPETRLSVPSRQEATDRPSDQQEPRLPQGPAARRQPAVSAATQARRAQPANTARAVVPGLAAADRRIADEVMMAPLINALADRPVDTAAGSAPPKPVAVDQPTIVERDRTVAAAAVVAPAEGSVSTTAGEPVVRAREQQSAAAVSTEPAAASGEAALRLSMVAPAGSPLAPQRFSLQSAPPHAGLAKQDPGPIDAAARPAGLSPPISGPASPRSWLKQRGGGKATRPETRRRLAFSHPLHVPLSRSQRGHWSRVPRNPVPDRQRARQRLTVLYGAPPVHDFASGPVLIRIHASRRNGRVRTTRIPLY
jgi:hypothetical protein